MYFHVGCLLFSCFTIEMFLVLDCIGFSCVNGAVAMFRRRVECIEFQLIRVRDVDHIVSGTGWNDDSGAVGQSMRDTVENRKALSGFYADKLVQLVYLLANLLVSTQTH